MAEWLDNFLRALDLAITPIAFLVGILLLIVAGVLGFMVWVLIDVWRNNAP
jgi:hypothetical protein